MPPKKAHELAVILIDVNASANESALSNEVGRSDFETCVHLADQLITRKIFSLSPDLFSIVFFGFSDPSQGFYIGQDFKPPEFDAIDLLNDIKPGTADIVDVTTAVDKALGLFDKYTGGNKSVKVTNKTVFLLSNLASLSNKNNLNAEALKLAKKLEKSDVTLIVGSPNTLLEVKDTPQFEFMQTLVGQSHSEWHPFTQCEKIFSVYNPKEAAPRGQPFDLQLDENVSLKVQMFVKNVDSKIEHKFTTISERGEEHTKHFHHVTEPELKVSINDLDDIPDEEFKTGKFSKANEAIRVVDSTNIITGYSFGKDIVPVTDMDAEDFIPKQETKQLKLIQFTSAENILPQYILSEARYFFPVADTEGTQLIMMDLVKELIESKRVALVRYAYNSAANPKVACLFPKLSKSGVPILIHYLLPFGEDLRNFEFPPLEDENEELTDYQTDAMDDFIGNMMLGHTNYPLKEIPDPRIQHECILIKAKALDPTITLPGSVDTSIALREMSRPIENPDLVDSLQNLADAFPLQIDPNNKSTHFQNRELGQPIVSLKFDDSKEDVKDFNY